MPAPANDNFANATVITGASGSTTGTTLLATAETGEPGHANYTPGPIMPQAAVTIAAANSVWFKWTCPASGTYFFSTRDTSGALATNYLSTCQVFTGAAVNALTYITSVMNQSVGDGQGADNGASIAFKAVNGTVYHIQIDGRQGQTGNFKLSWGLFVEARLGGCGGCPIDLVSEYCLASWEVPDVTNDASHSFGTFPANAGYYIVKYCGGTNGTATYPFFPGFVCFSGTYELVNGSSPIAYTGGGGTAYASGVVVYNNGGDLWISVAAVPATSPVGPSGSTYWSFTSHNSGSFLPFSGGYSPGTSYVIGNTAWHATSSTTWDTYTAIADVPATVPGTNTAYWRGGQSFGIEGTNACGNVIDSPCGMCSQSAKINHLGGALGMVYPKRVISGGTNANNPSVQLVYNPFLISMLNNSQGFLLNYGHYPTNPSQKIDLYITNTSAFQFENCTIIMRATGGVSSPSGPITGQTLTANSTTAVEFTFMADCTAGLVTVTIEIWRNGVFVGTLAYPLYPIYAVTLTTANSPKRTCTGFIYYEQTYTLACLWPPGSGMLDPWGTTILGVNPASGLPYCSTIVPIFTIPGGTPNLYEYSLGGGTATSAVNASCNSSGVLSVVANTLFPDGFGGTLAYVGQQIYFYGSGFYTITAIDGSGNITCTSGARASTSVYITLSSCQKLNGINATNYNGQLITFTIKPGLQPGPVPLVVPVQITFGFQTGPTTILPLPTYNGTLNIPDVNGNTVQVVGAGSGAGAGSRLGAGGNSAGGGAGGGGL
jgi:hypothetical protein